MAFRLDLNLKVLALSVLILPLLVALGFWQLDRMNEKQSLLDSYKNNIKRNSLLNLDQFEQLEKEDLIYRKLELFGSFSNQYIWYVENKFHQGQLGYEIIVPFTTPDDKTILVNLGWIAALEKREVLPAIELSKTQQKIKAFILDFSSNRLLQQQKIEDLGLGRYRLLQLSRTEAEQTLGNTIAPYMLVLDAQSPGALSSNWTIINTQPEKHQAYAVQWFLMAVALVVANCFVHITRETKGEKQNGYQSRKA